MVGFKRPQNPKKISEVHSERKRSSRHKRRNRRKHHRLIQREQQLKKQLQEKDEQIVELRMQLALQEIEKHVHTLLEKVAAGQLQKGNNVDPDAKKQAGTGYVSKVIITGGMVDKLMSADVQSQLKAARKFRKLLSTGPNSAVEAVEAEVVAAGLVPQFVKLLKRDDYPLLQFEAACALTNVAGGTSTHTRIVVESGAVPIFVQLIKSASEDVREQAVWALGNIAGDTPDCRNYVLDCQILQPLIELLGITSKLSTVRKIVWTLSNLCNGKNPPPDFEKVQRCLPTLARLLFHTDPEVLADACGALSYLSNGPNERIQAVIDAGVSLRLVELLMHSQPNVVSAALRAVGKIMPGLVTMLCKADPKTRKEAAWAVTNALTNGSLDQIRHIAQSGIIPALCKALTVADTGTIQLAVTALKLILNIGEVDANATCTLNAYATVVEECGGCGKIEHLQHHENVDIRLKACEIVEKHFTS